MFISDRILSLHEIVRMYQNVTQIEGGGFLARLVFNSYVFAALCLHRGYTMEQVALAIVQRDEHSVIVDTSHPAFPHERSGLGDRVAAGLAAVGITAERVSKALGRPCGCKERQAKLNELGRTFGIG